MNAPPKERIRATNFRSRCREKCLRSGPRRSADGNDRKWFRMRVPMVVPGGLHYDLALDVVPGLVLHIVGKSVADGTHGG